MALLRRVSSMFGLLKNDFINFYIKINKVIFYRLSK
jgi:hypothetical protein